MLFVRRLIFQVIKKKQFICFSFKINSKNNFSISRSVFYSRNVCVSNRNIYISYIHTVAYVSFPSCLNREDQYVVSFSIFLITRSTNCKDLPLSWKLILFIHITIEVRIPSVCPTAGQIKRKEIFTLFSRAQNI